MNGTEFRKDLVLRASIGSSSRWKIPSLNSEPLLSDSLELISFSNTKFNDSKGNINKGVHFFEDDPRFERVYSFPNRQLQKLKQYKFLLTPDFSVYADDMPWHQLYNIGRSRWVGSYWQQNGLHVYPTVSWGTPETFEFCFSGLEKCKTVAISTLGSRRSKGVFMLGYNEMINTLHPKQIICFGKPFKEMRDITFYINYQKFTKKVR